MDKNNPNSSSRKWQHHSPLLLQHQVKNNKLNINNLKIANKSFIRIVNNYKIIITLIKINMDKLSIKVYNLMKRINL
jgi:hypothetical protein